MEISKVQPNSMAAQRGLKSGDIIIGINRQPIESTQDLRKALDENHQLLHLISYVAKQLLLISTIK